MPPGGWAKPKASGLSIGALVCGIVSCCIWVVPFIGIFLVPVLGIVAIVLGTMGMKAAKQDPVRVGGKGLAIAGLVLGIVSLVLGVLLLILSLFAQAFLEDVCTDPQYADLPSCQQFNANNSLGSDGMAPPSPPSAIPARTPSASALPSG